MSTIKMTFNGALAGMELQWPDEVGLPLRITFDFQPHLSFDVVERRLVSGNKPTKPTFVLATMDEHNAGYEQELDPKKPLLTFYERFNAETRRQADLPDDPQ